MAQERRRQQLVHTAETIGAALGQAAAKVDAWKKQRAKIAAELHALAEAARAMLKELGETPAGEAATTPGNGGGRANPEAALSNAAWTRRKMKNTATKEHSKPSDSRAVIRATEGKRWTARQRGRG